MVGAEKFDPATLALAQTKAAPLKKTAYNEFFTLIYLLLKYRYVAHALISNATLLFISFGLQC